MPIKRKGQPLGLDRRVRPKKQEDWELEQGSEQESSDDQASEQEIRGGRYEQDDSDSENDDQPSEGEDEEGSEDDQEDQTKSAKAALSSISFGALAKAQASLPASRRKSKQSGAADEEPEEKQSKRWERPEKRSDPKKVQQRTSKRAPQEQSSKKPVSRRRELVHDNRRKARDPRFDAMMGTTDEAKSRKAYSFLDDYRDSEMADLRAQIKKSKTPDAKEELKRELMSMESRKKARVRKDEEEKLLKEHKQAEKDLVAQGKTPFYLKKSVQKTQVLTNRFNKMSKGAVDRAIERKRKKVAGKEKKELDFLQRVPNRH